MKGVGPQGTEGAYTANRATTTAATHVTAMTRIKALHGTLSGRSMASFQVAPWHPFKADSMEKYIWKYIFK